ALILGGSLVTAAYLMSQPRQPAPVAEDDAGKKKLADEQRKLDEEKKALKEQASRLDAEKLVERGNRALKAGSLEDARRHFQEALDKVPRDPDAQKGLDEVAAAEAAAKGKAGDDAKREADRLALLEDAKKAMADKEPSKAVQMLDEARRLYPADREILA